MAEKMNRKFRAGGSRLSLLNTVIGKDGQPARTGINSKEIQSKIPGRIPESVTLSLSLMVGLVYSTAGTERSKCFLRKDRAKSIPKDADIDV